MKCLTNSIRNVEHSYKYTRKFCSDNYASESQIDRLDLESILVGHEGCVNCLEWTEDGETLASGSDDCRIYLFQYFNREKSYITSGHTANIFSIKFMPKHNNGLIVSGAADYKVILNDVQTEKICNIFDCNQGRVKRLATTPENPYNFWSASEDGTIREYDIREPLQSKKAGSKNVLIDLTIDLKSAIEARSLAISPTESHCIAVGSNDHVIRIYDRRNLSLSKKSTYRNASPRGSDDNSLVYCMAARNLTRNLFYETCVYSKRYSSRMARNHVSTYVTYSSNGQEVLANISNNSIYLFDTKSSFNWNSGYQPSHDPLNRFFMHDLHEMYKAGTDVCRKFEYSFESQVPKSPSPDYYRKVERKLRNKEFYRAIDDINCLLVKDGNNPKLLALLSIGLILRDWDGDIYEALKCIEQGLKHCSRIKDSSLYSTLELLACRCLIDLNWIDDAECRLAVLAADPRRQPYELYFDLLQDQIQTKHKACLFTTATRTNLFCRDFLKNLKKYFLEPEINGVHWKETVGSVKLDDNALSDKSLKDCLCSECRLMYKILRRFPDIFRPNSSDWFSLEMKYLLKLFTHPETQLKHIKGPQIDVPPAYGHRILDYKRRYVGHSNVSTEIKEAVFFGMDDSLIAAGSDCGTFIIWSKATGKILRILTADEMTVNCIAPHKQQFLIATSGIDKTVKMWSPRPYFFENDYYSKDTKQTVQKKRSSSRVVTSIEASARVNQTRADMNPIQILLSSLHGEYYFPRADEDATEGEDFAEPLADSEMMDHDEEHSHDDILDRAYHECVHCFSISSDDEGTINTHDESCEGNSFNEPLDDFEAKLEPKVAEMIFNRPPFVEKMTINSDVSDSYMPGVEEGLGINSSLRSRLAQAIRSAYRNGNIGTSTNSNDEEDEEMNADNQTDQASNDAEDAAPCQVQ